jgi:hypothetical protein
LHELAFDDDLELWKGRGERPPNEEKISERYIKLVDEESPLR